MTRTARRIKGLWQLVVMVLIGALMLPISAVAADHHLDAPKLTVSVGEDSLNLAWDDVGGEAYWAVVVDAATGRTVWASEFPSHGRTATVKLSAGTYEAKVRGLGQPGVRDGETAGPWSNQVVATIGGCQTPATPEVIATPDGDFLNVKWLYDDVPGYPAEFTVSVDPGDQYAAGVSQRGMSVPWDKTKDTVVGVRAMTTCGSGDEGKAFVDATETSDKPPGKIRNLEIEAGRFDALVISWDPPVDGGPVDYYDVRASINNGAWVGEETTSTRYLVTLDEPLEMAEFYVRAVNEFGAGPWAYGSVVS